MQCVGRVIYLAPAFNSTHAVIGRVSRMHFFCSWPSSTVIITVAVVGLSLWIVSKREAISDELYLLVECHATPTHHARQVADLRKELKKMTEECTRLRDEKNTCLLDKDIESSHVKSSQLSSYRTGFVHATVLVTIICVIFVALLLCLLCKVYDYFSRRSYTYFQQTQYLANLHQYQPHIPIEERTSNNQE